MELSSYNIKKFPIFSSKESFSYILENGNRPKKFLIFQETELYYISGNGSPLKTSHISESNFMSSKNKEIHSE